MAKKRKAYAGRARLKMIGSKSTEKNFEMAESARNERDSAGLRSIISRIAAKSVKIARES
jgi:hypothetical protein